MEKDCKIEFNGGRPDHLFRSRDLDLALKWAKDTNADVKCIRTPWFTLSVLDDKTYDNAMAAFD